MRRSLHAAAATAFLALATLNAGGYRYGAADQAFYIPAILKQLDPSIFPRDSALVGPQARYFFVDEIVAAAVRTTGWPIETWFLLGYVATLVALYWGLWRLGQELFANPYATWALLAIETLRHRITKTGVNTLEGYFHPRVLVFAIGVWAIALWLRGRTSLAVAAVLVAGLLHPTTAAFFIVFLVPAVWVTEPRARRTLGVIVTTGTVGAAWLLLRGPLAEGVAPMDVEWRALLDSKDYLFPLHDWGMGAWLANLGSAAVAIGVLAFRQSAGIARPREAGLLAGAIALTLGFVVTLPMVTAGSALFVQLQISRVFWILDLLGTVALLWLVFDRGPRPRAAAPRWSAGVVVFLAAAALARGVWSTLVEHPERTIVAVSLPDDDWTRVIGWAAAQPVGTHLLADPGHAFRFGAPLRYSGRDVFLEEVKDTAMALYDRAAAARVIERQAAIGDFATLDAPAFEDLARRYRLDFVVIDRDLALPLAERFGPFRVYRAR